MEEDGEETPRTPIRIQSTTNVRRASSLFFNSGVLVSFLLSLAILCMVLVIPSLISFTSQILKPNLVKKTWDSINLVLVLLAVAFGFLSRNINKDNDINTNTPRFENEFDRTRSDLSTGVPFTSPVMDLPQPSTAARAPRPTATRVLPVETEKPIVPIKMSFFSSIDDSSSGGESPMNRIPPRPFKMPDWKFPVEGDYVRVQSTLNSDSGSPDGDESQSPSSAVDVDVDAKADAFIARVRDRLILEEMH